MRELYYCSTGQDQNQFSSNKYWDNEDNTILTRDKPKQIEQFDHWLEIIGKYGIMVSSV